MPDSDDHIASASAASRELSQKHIKITKPEPKFSVPPRNHLGETITILYFKPSSLSYQGDVSLRATVSTLLWELTLSEILLALGGYCHRLIPNSHSQPLIEGFELEPADPTSLQRSNQRLYGSEASPRYFVYFSGSAHLLWLTTVMKLSQAERCHERRLEVYREVSQICTGRTLAC